ncbi:hypothetical protein [Cohnella terricola]|uniref:Uncharacterized protein n=1 Tax=Cohnella terricola TaxID=1289167 RepID=A0A559JLB4_9BACL|nr:hypothetical protein [Cohnella terricola]TVY00666.1 hypothetical protein FPZ45_11715 [Cohnella terricola]
MQTIMRKAVAITGTMVMLFGLSGCLGASIRVPADQAFALSASALSGSDNYAFTGEMAVINPGGKVGSRASYEGEVSDHGNLKVQWKNLSTTSESTARTNRIDYRPLQILETINGQTATISYSEKPIASQPVSLQIQLDEKTAKERISSGLKKEMALVRADSVLVGRHPERSEEILTAADKRLERMLSTLKATTVVHWKANPKNWFPYQMKEETVLSYEWQGKPYQEKRTAETNFLVRNQGGTIK